MPNRSFEAMLLPMPDFLYHYMSIESLISMMNAESFQKGHLLKFHQSSIFHMNDGLEYGWFEAKTDEGGDKYIVKFEIGDPFAFCFSECEDCIPMWEMYGNHAKGVCLKFYAKKLRNFGIEEIIIVLFLLNKSIIRLSPIKESLKTGMADGMNYASMLKNQSLLSQTVLNKRENGVLHLGIKQKKNQKSNTNVWKEM